MERERKFKIVALVAVIIAVIGLSIAFAAMSRTLNINGRGNVDPANFDIYFTNLSQPTLKGEASVSGTPTLATKGVTISNMNVTLKKPNDSVVYTVDIKNDGDIDAEIENLVLPTFTSAQQELFDFTVVYTNGGQAVSIGDTLAKGETRNVTITFKYKDITDESLLPQTAQQISLSYQIIYKQTNKEVLASGSSGHNSGGNSSIGAFTRTWDLTPTITMTYTSSELVDGKYKNGSVVLSGTGSIPNPEGENDIDQFTLNLLDAESTEQVMNNQEDYITIDGENFSFNYMYEATSLTIGEGITGIGNQAIGSSTIRSISLPTTITTIDDDTFDSFSALHDITIPATSLAIGVYMFEGTPVEEIYIAASSVNSVPQPEGSSSISYFRGIQNDNYTIYCKYQSAVDDILAMTTGDNPTSYVTGHIVVDPTKFN